MSRREAVWIGSLACVVALLLAVPFAPGVVRAASEGGGHEGGLISLDRSLIVQLINFVILLVILTRLLYRPFLAKMRERTEAIQKSLEEAQAARAEAARQQAGGGSPAPPRRGDRKGRQLAEAAVKRERAR